MDKDQWFEADNSKIQYVGRIDFSDPKAPKFSAAGTYIEAKFNGVTVDVEITEEHKYSNCQFFQVSIDENAPIRFQTVVGQTIYRVASNLPSGTHIIRITKDSEASIGWMQFKKIHVEELLAHTLPSRKIECFGNSITCGAGIYSDLCNISVDSKWYYCTSAAKSYGALVAKKLNAQYHLTSWSGIGLTKSCCNMTVTMPTVYDLTFIEGSSTQKWDFSKYVPDVVTICLGQNDGIIDSATFINAYINFIDKLKVHYPNTQFLYITSPMSDNTLYNYHVKCLTAIENYYINKGDNKVHKVFLSHNLNNGCTTHPDGTQHETIATEIEAAIKNITGW
jgi:lysophospholipase L1-like esterase